MAVEILQSNRELAEAINAEARRDPGSPYARKYVGLADGKVVAVSDDLYELTRVLLEAEPDHTRCFCFCAGVNPTLAEEFWSPIWEESNLVPDHPPTTTGQC